MISLFFIVHCIINSKKIKLFILKITIFTLIIFLSLSASCQKKDTSDLSLVTSLPHSLGEISGITSIPMSKNLYAINDSGNENVLLSFNQKGKVIQTFKIPNSDNKDWEDITYDDQNNIYIGDFGNNDNKRKDLTIYKISGLSDNHLKASKIEFSLEDQKKFPPSKKNKNFDIEAFIYKEGYFYLFTKNRSSKFNGKTKLYKVPNKPGKQLAKLITSYKVCNDPNDCFITGAAINNEGTTIALLTYNKVLILSEFIGDNLFNGKVDTRKLHHSSQKESICFKNNNTLFIAEERTKKSKGNLYQYRLD